MSHLERAKRALVTIAQSEESLGVSKVLDAQLSPIVVEARGPVFQANEVSLSADAWVDFLYSPPAGGPYSRGPALVLRAVVTEELGPFSIPQIDLHGTGTSPDNFHMAFDGRGRLTSDAREHVEKIVSQEVVAFLGDSCDQAKEDMILFRATLSALNAIFSAPLHPCENCQSHFEALAMHHVRQGLTAKSYGEHCLHQELFAFNRYPEIENVLPHFPLEWLDPALRGVLEGATGGLRSIMAELVPGRIFTFPLFTERFCDLFMEEIDHFSAKAPSLGIDIHRPNSMNRYGVIVNQMGLEKVMSSLQRDVLQAVARELFPVEGCLVEHHHSFIVRYKQGEDLGLDMHTDDSDVTFNACLGKEFEGSGLQFCGMIGSSSHRKASVSYKHVKGACVVHLGTQRHGADDISNGERNNLIIWCRNKTFRGSTNFNKHQSPQHYERETSPPDLVCLSFTHDHDFALYKEYPDDGKKAGERAGWCPPPGKEWRPD